VKIAFCVSEAVPFAKTGGIADVCGALPLTLGVLGEEVIVIIPKYQEVSFSGAVLNSVDADYDRMIVSDNVTIYFVKAEMFLRKGLYGDESGDYPDNLRRFSYFCRKALLLFKRINFYPEVIHCHEWQTSLVPLFLKAFSQEYFPKGIKKQKCLLTIHNLSDQGIFPKEQMFETGLDSTYFSLSGLESSGKINLLKGGILYADSINTVSPTYSRQIQTKEYGCGLEDILKKKAKHICGIVNGIDYKIWNPQGDPHIFKNYSLNNLEDKNINKIELQKILGLELNDKLPLLGFVGRLLEQKGIDLIAKSLLELCQKGIQAVILGSGEKKFESLLKEIAAQYPSLVSFNSGFNDRLAHRIYAGCDLFLMPSRFEPCGISQLICFKYGTVPVCFKTGGLVDTVVDYKKDVEVGNGFVFARYTEGAFILALERAMKLFKDKEEWKALVKRIMCLNFSWKESAKRYSELYHELRHFGHVLDE